VVVSSLALLALLVSLELGLRWWVGPVQPGNVTTVPAALLQKSDFPGLRYVFRPGSRATQEFGSDPRGYFDPGARLTYQINALGFRGPEVGLPKPAGTLRIAGLGDSVLFGTGVRDEHVLTTVLQEELRRAGVPCEVLNLGVPTYDTFEESVFFRRVGLGLEPDLAFFLFFLNDTNAVGGVAFEAFNRTGERTGLRRVSVLYDHLAARAARREAVQQLVRDYAAGFADDAPGWMRARQGLEKAHEAAQKRGVPLVLVIFPLLFELDQDYPFAEIHARVASAGRELGYHVLDLLPSFLGQDGPALWVHPTNQHPNEHGHELAARALARFLIEERLVR
jgi:lysophospholipase L1-like esterase